jgi:hypothetical protein
MNCNKRRKRKKSTKADWNVGTAALTSSALALGLRTRHGTTRHDTVHFPIVTSVVDTMNTILALRIA